MSFIIVSPVLRLLLPVAGKAVSLTRIARHPQGAFSAFGKKARAFPRA
jgi:hypothetical protein